MTIRSSSNERVPFGRQVGGVLVLAAIYCTTISSVPEKKAEAMFNYDEAVGQLQSPTTWCAGAEVLVKLGDPRALAPLVRATMARAEMGKRCLYDAIEKLGGEKEARRLITHAAAEERRIGVRLMELFPSDEQLPALEVTARSDEDETLRALAIDTLGLQKQTPRWEALMVRLLDAPDEKLRGAAIENLATRFTDSARQALRDHLPQETSAKLRGKLEAAIETNVSTDHRDMNP